MAISLELKDGLVRHQALLAILGNDIIISGKKKAGLLICSQHIVGEDYPSPS